MAVPDEVAAPFAPALVLATRHAHGAPALGVSRGAALHILLAGIDGIVPERTCSETSAATTAGRLSALFGVLLERIEAYGGKMLTLQPDALLACWPAAAEGDAGLAAAGLAAAACGLELQDTPVLDRLLQPPDPSDEYDRAGGSGATGAAAGGAAAMLRQRSRAGEGGARGLRVGVGCGDVVLMLAGGRHGTQLVCGGDAAMQAAAAAAACALKKASAPAPVPPLLLSCILVPSALHGPRR